MNLKNLYEGLFGGAVTVALTVTGLIGQKSAGIRGLATAFVASSEYLARCGLLSVPSLPRKRSEYLGSS